MSESARKPLSERNVALLRAVVRWRKANGVEFVNLRSIGAVFYRMPGGVQVTWDVTASWVGFAAGRGESYDWHRVANVTQAIDLVVAFGYLPPRFSSAYRIGWDAANVADTAREMRRWFSPAEYDALRPAGWSA